MKRMRTTSRIIAMILLYNYELNKQLDYDGIFRVINEEGVSFDDEFLKDLVEGVIQRLKEIDYNISINLENYTIDRLSIVDKNIIRIAVYELLRTDTPVNIIINEAIDISKVYSETEDYQSSKFNNSLLDKIARGVRNGN